MIKSLLRAFTLNWRFVTYLLFSFSLFLACGQNEDRKESDKVRIDLHDSRTQHILGLQTSQNWDSLMYYARQGTASERYLSVAALTDAKKGSILNSIPELLQDQNSDVLYESVYSLGQLGNEVQMEDVLQMFKEVDTNAIDQRKLGLALEAVGRIGDSTYLKYLATISTYTIEDRDLLFGQALGIYRYLLRGMEDSTAHARMIDFACKTDYPENTRIVAAQYLLKTDIQNRELNPKLYPLISEEENDGIRRNIWSYLARSQSIEVRDQLIEYYRSPKSDRADKLAILDALENYRFSELASFASQEMRNADVRLATEAADLCVKTGRANNGKAFLDMSFKQTWPWYVMAKIQHAVNVHLVSPEAFKKINLDYIVKNIQSASSPEEKIAFIQALGSNPVSYPRMIRMFDEEMNHMVKLAIANELVNLVEHDKIAINYRIHNFVQKLLSSGDDAYITKACELMMADARIAESISVAELESIRSSLSIPKQIEAYIMLYKVIVEKTGRRNPKTFVNDVGLYKQIPWEILDGVDMKDVQIEVNTTKGSIGLKLYPEIAPISVVNFVKLAKSGFYDNQTFHRVVNNFVLQAGCARGDGFGSLDYVIPTETKAGVHFLSAGMLGMASAGRNTESSQWFITLGPTLHLDGNYTLFGRVVQGLDILENIDEGDLINSVKIIHENDTEKDGTTPSS